MQLSIFSILALISGIGSFVCFIIVLIQLFQAKGAGHGILGILCGLYTFIWGWMNATALNLKKVMVWWSVLLVLSMVLNGIATAAAVKAAADQGAFDAPSRSTLPNNP